MFLEQLNLKDNSFIKYIRGSLVIILFHFLGQIPISLYLIYGNINLENIEDKDQIFSLLPPNLGLILVLIPFTLSLLALWFVITKLHDQPFQSLITADQRINFKKIIFAFLLWGSFSALLVISDYLMSPEHYEINFKPLPFLILFLIATIMIPIQTSVEELIFLNNLNLSNINAQEKIELAIKRIITNLTTKSALMNNFHKEKSVFPPKPTT